MNIQEKPKKNVLSEKSKKVADSIAKCKNTVILLVVLYISVTIPLIVSFYNEIFYAITHKEDIQWIENTKNQAWEERKLDIEQEEKVEAQEEQIK